MTAFTQQGTSRRAAAFGTVSRVVRDPRGDDPSRTALAGTQGVCVQCTASWSIWYSRFTARQLGHARKTAAVTAYGFAAVHPEVVMQVHVKSRYTNNAFKEPLPARHSDSGSSSL